jgi:F-type H+-transporting ATPase subunit b
MEPMLRAVGDIVLRALPTFFLVLFLYLYIRAMFVGPIGRILEERRAATLGAREAAKVALERAEEKVKAYEEKLREARGELFRETEALRKQWRDAQSAQLAAARDRAMDQVKAARAELDRDAQAARAALEAEAGTLANDITLRILQGGRA